MKRITLSLFVLTLGLLGFNLSAAADTVFDFNASNQAVSSNDSQAGDITEAYVQTIDGVTLTVSPANESATNPNRFWGTNAGPQLRCYSGTITIESENSIKSVVFDAPSKFDVTADVGELSSTTWSGDAKKIVFTVNKNSQINKITVSSEAAEVPSMPEAANFAAFKALEKGTEAKLTLNNAYVTAVSGNNAYVQDATGALYFYNTGLALEAGKVLNGTVIGKLDIYSNLPEFTKTSNTNADNITVTDGTATIKNITVAEALTADYVSMLVKIVGATIEEDGGKYYAVDGESKIQIFDQFRVLAEEFQYPGKADITCIVGMYKGTPQLYLLDANSITEATESTFADGTYFLQNVAAQKFFAAGHSWGTQAIVNNDGLDIIIAATPEGKYHLDAQIKRDDTNHFVGSNLFTDSPAYDWAISKVADDIITLANDTAFIAVNEKDELVLVKEATEAAQWKIVTYEERIKALEGATEATPANATFAIKDANFGRCDSRVSFWSMEASNQNLSGGNNENNCAESWHSTFTLSQTIEGLPNGVYELTAQGFYRQDGEDTENLPYFFINDQKATFPVMTGTENSMSDASVSFTNGLYTIDPIMVMVTDGKITLGAKNEANLTIWCIWDNFQLKYLGENAAIVKNQTINHNREVGQGYGVSIGEVDFTEAKSWLGVDDLTTDMLNFENPDGSLIDYANYAKANYDGWCNGEGAAENWGGTTKVCVKFFQAIPDGKFEICDMNDADEVGKTYTVKWRLVNGDKAVRYTINVTFVAPQATELEIVDKGIVASVSYDSADASYIEKTVTLTDEQVAAICAELGISALSEATVYGYNPTTQELVKNYAGYDGWRDANGDFHGWSGDAEVPACVKYTDGQNYLCYNILGCEPQIVKTYWAIANDKKAVLVEIDFTYIDSTADPNELVINGDCEGEDGTCLVVKHGDGGGGFTTNFVDGAGIDGSRAVVIHAVDNAANEWDTQFFIVANNHTFALGEKYVVKFWVKADKPAKIGAQGHKAPGDYLTWYVDGAADVNVTTEWQEVVWEGTVNDSMAEYGGNMEGMQTLAFNLNNDKTLENNYYFDNISWKLVTETDGIETAKAIRVENGAIYNLSGQKVDANYKGVVIINGKKMLQK